MLTPSEFVEKHNRRLKAATADMKAGIEKVTVAPGVQAAAKQEKMLSKLTEAVTSGKWASRTKGVSLEEWKRKAAIVGVPRVSAGIDAAKEKVATFAAQFLPFVENVAKEVAGMDDLTLDDSVRRAEHQIRRTAEFRLK